MAAAPTVEPRRSEHESTDEWPADEHPWQVVVWNDPVTLMSYVVYVLRKLFGYDEQEATKLMLAVHYDGKATVSDGAREKCEADVARLHAYGLQATFEQP